jgi:hypothetical protein
MTATEPESTPESTPPPQPRRLRVRVQDTPDGLMFRGRCGAWGLVVFFVIWLAGWTVGCVFLAHEVIVKPQLFTILFGIPFWASWFFVAGLAVKKTFQVDTLVVGSESVGFERRVFSLIRRRQIPLQEIKNIIPLDKVTHGDGGDTHEWGVQLETRGEPLDLFLGVSQQESEWLAYQLNRCVESVRGPVESIPAVENATPSLKSDAPSEFHAEEPSNAVLPASTRMEPPSDSRWHRADDVDAVAFHQNGRFAWAQFGFVLFFNLFWNGIVSVFIVGGLFGINNDARVAGAEWWGLFFFLIPFEVIGVVGLGFLLLTLLEPVRKVVWRFGFAEIERRVTWFGLGPRQTYVAARLSRIDLRRSEPSQRLRAKAGHASSGTSYALGQGHKYALVFVDADNKELCTMPRLTEGEAAWIRDVLLRERRQWFARQPD